MPQNFQMMHANLEKQLKATSNILKNSLSQMAADRPSAVEKSDLNSCTDSCLMNLTWI